MDKGKTSVGVGRPKGRKNSIPDKYCKGASETSDIRGMLTQAFKENAPEILPRLFKELRGLEGYAYVTGVDKILKQILPALQSVEFNANIKEERSYLLKKVLELQQEKVN